ncbi:MAG: hypothetical protein ACYDCS_12340 [Candidatus Dormibacteria bacterium]
MPALAEPGRERTDRVTQTKMRLFRVHKKKGVWRCGSNKPLL